MPRAGFEPTIPVFKRLKTVRILDRAAIGTGSLLHKSKIYPLIKHHDMKTYRGHGCKAAHSLDFSTGYIWVTFTFRPLCLQFPLK